MSFSISYLNYLIVFFAISLISCVQGEKAPVGPLLIKDSTEVYYQTAMRPFYHGVASGDPRQQEVVIWTRFTPKRHGEYSIKWEISNTSDFAHILQTGEALTSSKQDYTVKKQIQDLKPDTYYWYRFSYQSSYSVIGRTKTLPENPKELRLVSVSCNAYESGYFNAFELIGSDTVGIDAIIHLGDYIYEGFSPKFITKKDRIPLPKKELISLQDYRTRYAQYRL
ncbi:MAG: PhoD-like phosphatase N-terminal domain-containing protein, partial [Bacteroidota bacterium]